MLEGHQSLSQQHARIAQVHAAEAVPAEHLAEALGHTIALWAKREGVDGGWVHRTGDVSRGIAPGASAGLMIPIDRCIGSPTAIAVNSDDVLAQQLLIAG